MKVKYITIAFILIVFGIAIVNSGNVIKSGQPVVDEYVNDQNVVDSVNELIDVVESNYNENFITKMSFVELQGLTRRAIGSNYYNTVLKLKNGYLTYRYDEFNVKKYEDEVAKLADYCESNNHGFIYVSVPFKIKPGDEKKMIRKGYYDSSNKNQDIMLNYLNEDKIDNYDLRMSLMKEYDNWYSAFFKTDQHWRPEAGFWGYTKIANKLHDIYGYNIDSRSLNLNNYTIKTFNKWFLGSQGKKTGVSYAGVDDFSLIYPKFDTNLSLEIPKHNIKREGNYYDVMFDMNNMKKDYYNINTYATYIGGDYPLTIEKNKHAVNDKKILILKDSFTLDIQPYFAFMFNEVHVIDLRHYKKSLRAYIDRIDPDLVMVLYTPSMMKYPEAFEYN